jgi:hypothetical protein
MIRDESRSIRSSRNAHWLGRTRYSPRVVFCARLGYSIERGLVGFLVYLGMLFDGGTVPLHFAETLRMRGDCQPATSRCNDGENSDRFVSANHVVSPFHRIEALSHNQTRWIDRRSPASPRPAAHISGEHTFQSR